MRESVPALKQKKIANEQGTKSLEAAKVELQTSDKTTQPLTMNKKASSFIETDLTNKQVLKMTTQEFVNSLR